MVWLKCLLYGRAMIDFIVISGLILHLGCEIMIVTSGISLYPGSLSWGFVPYMTLHVTLAGMKNVNHYIGIIVLSKFVISGFHCVRNVYSINLARRPHEISGLMREAIWNDNKCTWKCCVCAAWPNQNCFIQKFQRCFFS